MPVVPGYHGGHPEPCLAVGACAFWGFLPPFAGIIATLTGPANPDARRDSFRPRREFSDERADSNAVRAGKSEGLWLPESLTARLEYPSASCSPAEIASVSPSDGKVATMWSRFNSTPDFLPPEHARKGLLHLVQCRSDDAFDTTARQAGLNAPVRAKALSANERSEIASNAVIVREEEAGKTPAPRATHGSPDHPLKIAWGADAGGREHPWLALRALFRDPPSALARTLV